MAEKEKIDGPKAVNPNLSDFRDMAAERQKEIAAAGGKASGEARRRNKTFKDIAVNVLDLKAPPHIAKVIVKNFPELEAEEITNRVALLYSQLNKALKGNTRAFEVIRDTAGEKPTEKMEWRCLDTSPFEVKVVK